MTPPPAVLVVTTTVADAGSAERLARALVEQRLAACAQIDAITSVYRWDGTLRHEPEQRLTLKTTPERWPALRQWIGAGHPYALPQLVALTAEASTAYADWVREQVS